uniref:Uncharacterized protein n=1 Tax=Heterorhabditis bacteriophora TaxID=37862 RepID=A0A1I7WQH2_HETBA
MCALHSILIAVKYKCMHICYSRFAVIVYKHLSFLVSYAMKYDPDVHGPTQLPRLIRSVSRDIYEAELKNSYLLENPRSKSTRVYYQDQKQPPNQIGKNNYEKSHLNGPEYSQASQSFESSDYGSEGLSKRIERREKKAILDNAAVMRNTTSQHLMSAPTYDEFFSKSEIRYKTLPNPIRENPLDCGVQYKESHNLRRRDSKRKSLVRTVGKMLRKAFFGSHNKPRQYLDINEMNTKQNFLRSASKRSTSNGNLKDAGRDPSVLSQRQSSVRNLQHRLSTKSNRREESSGLTNNYLDYYIFYLVEFISIIF